MASASDTFPLERLPLEIFLECMKRIDFPTLRKCLTLSKRISAYLTGNFEFVWKGIAINEIGPDLLPIAICRFTANDESSGLPGVIAAYKENPGSMSNMTEYENCVNRFCEKYLRDQAMTLVDTPSRFKLDTMRELWAFHGVVRGLADKVINLESDKPRYVPYAFEPVERARLYRALYLHELVRLVVPYQTRQKEEARLDIFEHFWKCFAPWESAQVRCIDGALKQLMLLLLTDPGDEPGAMFGAEIFDGLYRLCVHQGLRANWDFLRSPEATNAHFSAVERYTTRQGTLYRTEAGLDSSRLWFSSPNSDEPALSFNMPEIMEKYKDFRGDSCPREAYFHQLISMNSWGLRGRKWYEDWERSVPREVFKGDYYSFFSRKRFESLDTKLYTMEELIKLTSRLYFDPNLKQCEVDGP